MKKLFIAFAVMASLPTFASDCESVDYQMKAYKVGLASHADVLDAMSCNLNEISSESAVCNTKIGIKKDILQQALKAYNVGLITEQQVSEARKDVAIQTLNCIK